MTVGGSVETEYVADMKWPHLPDTVIVGESSPSVIDAIDNLNQALQEDCAREMLENGQA